MKRSLFIYFYLIISCFLIVKSEIATIKQSWFLAKQAYCPGSQPTGVGKRSQYKFSFDENTFKEIKSPKGKLSCFFGLNKNTLYLVFRGTIPTNLENWARNIDFRTRNVFGFNVHNGFYGALEKLLQQKVPETENNLSEFIAESYLNLEESDRKLVLIGHSLGGAMASLAAFHFNKAYGISQKNIIVRLFSAPRVAIKDPSTEYEIQVEPADEEYYEEIVPNQVFNEYFDNFNHIQIVNGNDFVPHLPPKSANFINTAENVNYGRNQTNNDQISYTDEHDLHKDFIEPVVSLVYKIIKDVFDLFSIPAERQDEIFDSLLDYFANKEMKKRIKKKNQKKIFWGSKIVNNIKKKVREGVKKVKEKVNDANKLKEHLSKTIKKKMIRPAIKIAKKKIILATKKVSALYAIIKAKMYKLKNKIDVLKNMRAQQFNQFIKKVI